MGVVSQRYDAARTSRVSIGRGVLQGVVLTLAALLAARALYYCWTALPIIRWPFAIHDGEATMLYESQLLNSHLLHSLRAIYGPQRADRFVAGNYPPIYLFLWALKPGVASYITGRGLSLLGGIVAAIAGGVAVYATVDGGRLWRIGIATLGGAAFLSTVPVFQQIGIAKPDMVALAFAACGLACYAAFPDHRGALLAGLCGALAGLTKQSIGFATVAILLAALRQHWRIALTLVLACGVTVLTVLGSLWLIAGSALFEHLVLYNLRPWRQDRFDSLNQKFVEQHWPLLVAALVYTVWALRARPRSPLTYYPLTALVVMLMVGAEGAARNYYIELTLAIALGAALAVGTFLRSRPPLAASLGAGALVLVSLHIFRAYTLFTVGAYVPTLPPSGPDPNPILAQVDAAPDPVLILADSPDYLAMRGRPVVIDDPFLAQIMLVEHRWNLDAIVANIGAKRYSLVLTVGMTDEALRKAWGSPLVDALLANYRPDRDGYVPK